MAASLAEYHSCKVCSDFILDPDNASYNGDIKPRPKAVNEVFLFSNLSLDVILREASADCRLCEWLVKQWEGRDEYSALLERKNSLFLYATTYNTASGTFLPFDEISFFGLWDGMTLSSDGTSPKCFIWTHTPIDVLTPKGDDADKSIRNRPMNPNIGSPENMNLARGWLKACSSSHRQCPKAQPAFMPHRVLQVRTGASESVYDVRLCTGQTPAPYVALSYCWGGDQPHKTTTARMQAKQFDLNWDEIPKTIQDAVKVTVALQIGYLWIDSYCIIQNDPNDFALQMAEVPRIYADSTVTITASRSELSSEGFLQATDLNEVTLLAVRLPFRCADGRLGNAYITGIEKSRDTEPIDYRAWTMQEFYLPSRLLIFGTYQLRWQCAESQMEDGFNDGWKRGYNPEESMFQTSQPHSTYERRFKSFEREGMSPSKLSREAIDEWHVLISIYTFRKLGSAEDRSWAASGLAEGWNRIIKDEYLAGHWRKSLPSSLLWHIELISGHADHSTEHEPPRLRHRKPEYIAPSWSWTSILGHASFRYASAATPDTRLVLVDAGVELKEPKARYGAVTHGLVTVRGKVRDSLYYGFTSKNETEVWLERLPSEGPDSRLVITRTFPDAIEPEFLEAPQTNPASLPVHLLEVGCCVRAGKRGPVGLILRKVSQSRGSAHQTFKRLGMFHIDQKSKRPTEFLPESWDRRTRSELSLFDGCIPEALVIV